MKEQWKQDIRQRLADLEQPAPELQWDEIFRAVDAQKAARRHKTVVLWQRIAVAASVAAILAGGAVYLSHNSQDGTVPGKGEAKQIAARQGKKSFDNEQKQTEPSLGNEPYDSDAHATSTPIERLVASVTNLVTRPFTSSATESPVLLAENIEAHASSNNLITPEEVTEEKTTQQETPTRSFAKTGTTSPSTYHLPSSHAKQHQLGGDLTAKAYLAGALGSSNSTMAMGLMSSTSNDAVTNLDPSYSNDAENSMDDWMGSSIKDRQVKHHQPLRLGVSLRYQINDRWSVEGGVSYSHHSSDITETGGNFTKYTNQELTFIGIPINANYSIWSNRYVNVYASAGGEVERMVKGKAQVTTTYAGEDSEQREETVKMSRPVFSVNAAIGVEAKLGETFSLYAEPGVGYHFKNGSDVLTIYSDKPFNANLNLGVRFTLK